jgi:hypothetical protein
MRKKDSSRPIIWTERGTGYRLCARWESPLAWALLAAARIRAYTARADRAPISEMRARGERQEGVGLALLKR